MPTGMWRSVRWEGHRLVRYTMTGAVCFLVLTGCAGQEIFRSDASRLRADLSSQHAALVMLGERVDKLERRLATEAQASGQMQQELKDAVEVLLKKALETDTRLANLESARTPPRRAEKPAPTAQQRTSAVNGVAERRSTKISLGMTQEEVRQILGNPVSTENAGEYIFWQYSQLYNQQYVIFEQGNGRVSGWRGL
jgi:SmpA / OmlA family